MICNGNKKDLGEELSKLIEHRDIMFSMLMGGRIPLSRYLAFDKQVSMAISEKEKEYWDKHGLDFLKMETKEIKINVPDGYEIDKENSTFEHIKLKKVIQPIIEGYVPTNSGEVYLMQDKQENLSKIAFATEKQAKSVLAMAQISQIIANDKRFGGVVKELDFGNTCAKRFWQIQRIKLKSEKPYIAINQVDASYNYSVLTFYKLEQAVLFLEENEDLVKDYLMID